MKTLPFDKAQILPIIEQYPTPFYLYDEAAIRKNARALHAAFAWNAGFKEYFAVKAAPTPGLIQILKDEGCGVDCSSLSELVLAGFLGYKSEDIMFSSNETPAEEYQMAHELNAVINLDDITHIEFLEQVCGIPDTICMRYNPGGQYIVGNAIMDNPQEAKYGFTKEQILQGIHILRQKGVKHFGLHAFLASNMLGDTYYPALAADLFRLVVEIYEKTGVKVEFVNLSGGIGIPYKPEDTLPDITHIGELVHKAYDEIIVAAGLHPLAIKTELGRFMTGPYGYLITTAVHRKEIYKNYIGLDACAANLMRPAMYGAYHHITVLGKEDFPCDHMYDIVGSLCENNDKFAINRMLPAIEMGDILVLHDVGAHGHAMGYNYNGRLRSAELLLKTDSNVQMIRRAETLQDYFATLDFLDI